MNILHRSWRYGWMYNLHTFNFFHNIIRSIKISSLYWGRDDSDWSTPIALLTYQLELQGKMLEHSMHINGPRDVKNIRICVELLKRINEEDDRGAFYQAGLRYPSERGRAWARQVTILGDEYSEMFLRYFRHFQRWWA